MSYQKVEFTKEMKKTYTILVPDMLPIHFKMIKPIIEKEGYHVEVLNNRGKEVIDCGLKYVNNDTCYPAILVIGQMIDALKSGKYDTHKVALMITQTGGGCRASNYIHLLRKALVKSGYEYVPVISLNVAGLERNSGFKLTLGMLHKAMAVMVYGDLLMLLANQTRPYEIYKETDIKVDKWIKKCTAYINDDHGYLVYKIKRMCKDIINDFSNIKLNDSKKVKVGIVGEIYVKYSPLGNNDLEQFLQGQDVEYMIPGVLGFALYCAHNNIIDYKLYGGSFAKKTLFKYLYHYLLMLENIIINSVKENSNFNGGVGFEESRNLAKNVIGLGCKMGEGWLLTSEIMGLCDIGYENIVCAQPFGCLPNHINGKGMVHKILEDMPSANIVAIDYDASATKVNQENRIKLMLEMGREKVKNMNKNC